MNELLEQALKLPVAERVRFADELYMSVGGLSETSPLTDAQISEIERRIADYERNPNSAIPLEQFLERFDAR